MPRKTKTLTEATPTYPPSHLSALQEEGFTTVSYLHKAITVSQEGHTHSEWLPSLCVAPGDRPNQYRVIQWLPKEHPSNGYSFDGWSVSDGHTFGGMYETIGRALSWFRWHEANK